MDLGMIGTGLCMSIAAIGSCVGVVIAGTTCIGAWKKCYMSNKAAPFILTSFAGAPLTQTIYGFLLMQTMQGSSADPTLKLFLGIGAGLAMACSAAVQGMAGASGADAWLKQERALRSTLQLSVFARRSPCSCWYSAWLPLGNIR